jgi:very-short-patch-repair endonuclease
MDGIVRPSPKRDAAAAQVRQLRTRLLDLTARNPLVSFSHSRPTGTRLHVRAINANLDFLYRHLIGGKDLALKSLPASGNEPPDEKSDRFVGALEIARQTNKAYAASLDSLTDSDAPSAAEAKIERQLRDRVRAELGMPSIKSANQSGLADYATDLGIDPSFDLRRDCSQDNSYAPEFQTLLLPDPMDRALAKLRDNARTAVEEMGINTLYLAFGFLEWFESDDSEKALTSPLLLLQVELNRTIVRGRYQYQLAAVGDEVQLNLSLVERLHRDFRLRLTDPKEEESPSTFLGRIEEEVCTQRKSWRVRSFLTLAQFPFARIAMFQDLDEAQWGATGGLSSHPVLANLLAGGDNGEAMFSEQHDVDSPEVQASVPILVLDADGSQHSAVHDVMTGRDLVIEGPPGTGKSQTITNIIAAALSNGKRVLFVAEKQAALQVVSDRMEKVGLGPFCLELHSGKVRKKDVLDSLSARLNHRPIHPSFSQVDAKRQELGSIRARLTRHVRLLNSELGAFGATVHDVLWGDRCRRLENGEVARAIDRLSLPDSDRLTEEDLNRRRDVLARFERAAAPVLSEFGEPTKHPWAAVGNADLSSADFDRVRREVEDVASELDRGVSIAAELATLGVPTPNAIKPLRILAREVSKLPLGCRLPGQVVADLLASEARTSLRKWLDATHAYQSARSALEKNGLGAAAGLYEIPDIIDASLKALEQVDRVGLTVGDLPILTDRMLQRAERLRALKASLLRAAQIADVKQPDTVTEAREVLTAFRLAADLSGRARVWVGSRAMDEFAIDQVRKTAAVAAEIRLQAEQLGETFFLSDNLRAAGVRRHLGSLRSAGFLGWLKRDVRAAHAFYRGISRNPQKVNAAVAAAELQRLGDYLEARHCFEASASHRELFGDRFRGVETDTNDAVAAADWAAGVRSELSGIEDLRSALRETLLSGNRERLARMAAAAQAGVFGELAADSREYSGGGTYEGRISDCESHVTEIERLAAACAKLGLPADTPLTRLPEVCRMLRNVFRLEGAARVPSGLPPRLEAAASNIANEVQDFEHALALAAAAAGLALSRDAVAHLLERGLDFLRAEMTPVAVALAEVLESASESWNTVRSKLAIRETALFGSPFDDCAPGRAADALRRCAEYEGGLGGWISYLMERRSAEELRLRDILSFWDMRLCDLALSDVFDRVLYQSLSRLALKRDPDLARFTGLGLEEARRRFKQLDLEVVELGRRLLASQLASRPVPLGIGEGKKSDFTDRALILNEISKQKRHIPIRQLLDRAGGAVQALKPCFMMSPLSVAQFLKPNGMRFDLLVIDEASQMKPEDALGAVARAAQIVVVGDPKQLPPTSFFDRSDEPVDDEESEDETVDSESILDLGLSVFRPARRLRWHYRSRHASLVAFSNREFYDDDLIVFPSPTGTTACQGVASVRVDGIYKNRTNAREVEEITKAAAEFMHSFPDMSLGIVALNEVQKELILQEMDRLGTTHPHVQDYRDRWAEGLERFFVKNLENVQGDERDAIFISTVFGPPAPGGKVRQNFGPINGKSGHRRLNVLFTRAKHHVRLFTSMGPDDVLAPPDGPRGARVLKAYLAYAASGRLDAGMETGRECDSDFEVFVQSRLRQAGYDVVPQVGVAGFFIDLGVKDPDVEGTFLLGIECDGAAYHSTKSARDRDILRQQVLEGLGWTIYRIWSTDWFRDPVGQTRRMIDFIEGMRARRTTK